MSGSAVNRGGVRFEHFPDQDSGFQWWARMRNHAGHGPTMEDAADDLVAEIAKELESAKSARATLRAKETP